MATTSTWGLYPLPVASEAADVPLDLMQLAEALDPHTVLFASSVSDRNTKYNGIPAGSLDVCTALKTVWMSLGASVWHTMAIDTGWVTTGFGYPNADWSVGSARIRIKNGVTELRMYVQRAGADLVAHAVTGNLADVTVATLPSTYWPLTFPIYLQGYVSGSGITMLIDLSGNIQIVDTQPGYTITSGDYLKFSATWLDG